jgi:Uma2 family endonuclease
MTAEELFALPTDDRTDRRLIRGRLVARPYPFRCPAHAAVVANLCGILGSWVRSDAGDDWSLYGYGCPYRLRRDPDTVLYFDASIIPAALGAATPKRASFIDGRPTLAVEVIDLSDPADAVAELTDVSLTNGVRMLWVIDPIAETVAVHRPGVERVVLTPRDDLDTLPLIPGLRCRVADIFE